MQNPIPNSPPSPIQTLPNPLPFTPIQETQSGPSDHRLRPVQAVEVPHRPQGVGFRRRVGRAGGGREPGDWGGVATAVEEEVQVEPSEVEKLKRGLIDAFYRTDRGLKTSSETRTDLPPVITHAEQQQHPCTPRRSCKRKRDFRSNPRDHPGDQSDGHDRVQPLQERAAAGARAAVDQGGDPDEGVGGDEEDGGVGDRCRVEIKSHF
ncbi:Chromoplast-specific carotenoid-associated protein, chromoplast [Acorus calamus]|uniref:Chromoplast-specific carotenoid-associated protein, chromoplast n=1 Tax=Acorus calamus TaxID=4465 RepID=A0AAV9DN85_ACOCL|nr:Chromoplast-specific carotenoid-associated protein, chromoplast [Acorus calamus]